MAKVEWDYTEHARHYDKRADYSRRAIIKLLEATGCAAWKPIADIGAGTGKLTKELLGHGLFTHSVEPNDAMRAIGQKNTEGKSAEWHDGTGEATGLGECTVHAAFFGSSFNVVDQQKCLQEVVRILAPHGWFACMWNHRALNDRLQASIEAAIKSHVPGYSYGSRREDPTAVIDASGSFSKVQHIEESFVWPMRREDIIEAWRSHATLGRQAGDKFAAVIDDIETLLAKEATEIFVPYVTRIWYAQCTVEKTGMKADMHAMANS